MRTTIDIPDPLFKRAKAAAAKQGVTLREVVLRALDAHLAAGAARKPYRFRWKGVDLGVPPEVLEEILEDRDRAWVRGYLGEQRRR